MIFKIKNNFKELIFQNFEKGDFDKHSKDCHVPAICCHGLAKVGEQ